MTRVFIVGVGMTPCGKFLDQSVKTLAQRAVDEALTDAGLERRDVQSAFFANATQDLYEGQHMIAGQVALRAMGMEGIAVFNVENACASGASALHLAASYIRSGASDVALAVGVEKMSGFDRAKTFSVFNGAWDVEHVDRTVQGLQRMGEGVEEPPTAGGGGERSVFMDLYASLAKLHMKTFGSTQRQYAAVASKNHGHSVHNPLAQYRSAMTVDEVLQGRLIAWPLTLPMCSPISDGAAAALLVSEERLKSMQASSRAVEVLASVVASGTSRRPEEYEKHICRTAALKAYEQASIGPGDISVAEVHDASAFAEVLQSELLGFCDFGEGGSFAERGATSIGGRIPINTSGGLVSKGHPIGATGLTQIHELVAQLRGEAGKRQVSGARFALAENGGGFQESEEAAAAVTILKRRTA